MAHIFSKPGCISPSSIMNSINFICLEPKEHLDNFKVSLAISKFCFNLCKVYAKCLTIPHHQLPYQGNYVQKSLLKVLTFCVVPTVIKAVLTDASGIGGIYKYTLPKSNCMNSLRCVGDSNCFPISSEKK